MKCLNCGQIILQQLTIREIIGLERIIVDNLCHFCRQQLKILNDESGCNYCSKSGEEAVCQDCLIWQKEYQLTNYHSAIFSYNRFMHDYFKKYKRYGDVILADMFQKDLQVWAQKNKFDLVTYVPSSQSHLELRGFDPVYELYRNIFKLEKLFKKNDSDKPQSQKNKRERMRTPQTFRLGPGFRKSDSQKKVLIVDDIYTTGRTILHARHLLEINGFQNIYTFSLTR
ncbi:ComF family protein [Companilactobacillus versmoldensis]|uniref:Amidophosphoribosyltransferase-like protein n=1 Tax=Companilactobacillus versmoldensis DSM 14857 = KCTC 3814 TaxID=1423815 RepID=A0A0R1SF55_9LACO|nr:phosphoribosyltransferase family protein [Companilactobacillus versmoldensis]KRL67708.1 amidophosphoribosyltransferase-like protein [Companilactobacillus versmoldensis DSM 14857 = KCTC 3814]